MEKKEIIEGNRLIAEFMGLRIGVDKYSYRVGATEPLHEKHLDYHKSWDWLIPVVEKIGNLSKKKNKQLWGNIVFALRLVKKEEIYKEVIEYIKWYNNQPN